MIRARAAVTTFAVTEDANSCLAEGVGGLVDAKQDTDTSGYGAGKLEA